MSSKNIELKKYIFLLKKFYNIKIIFLLSSIIFIGTLITSFLFPLYPDEIAARFWLNRLPYDFPLKITNMPTCISGYIQRWPVTWIIPGMINWIIFILNKNPISQRIIGIIIAILWVISIFYYLYKKSNNLIKLNFISNKDAIFYLSSFVLSVLTVGVFPIFLILTRNEELIPISITVLIFLFLKSMNNYKNNNNLFSYFITFIIYFSSVSLIIFAHPKGEFLIPFFIFIGYKIFHNYNNKLLFYIVFIVLLIQIFQGYRSWAYSFRCPEVPRLDHLLKSFSFDPFSIFYNTDYFFKMTLYSLRSFPKYLLQIGFQSVTDINYLPPSPVGKFTQILNFFIHFNIAIMFLLIPILLIIFYINYNYNNRNLKSINIALLILYACIFISGIFNLPKNWYDPGYLYFILIIIYIFFVGENFYKINNIKIFKILILYLTIISIFSQLVFINRLLPSFLKGYEGPGISMIVFFHQKNILEKDIKKVAIENGINFIDGEKIIVDDLTYFYFAKNRIPMPITYIFDENDPSSIHHFITQVNSSGIIVRCSYMPIAFQAYATRIGSICGISKDNIKKLPISGW